MSFRQQNWKRLLKQHGQLLLPSVCDALGAKLIQHCGFPAYQIGGFALDGMRHGFPDMDVARLGEKSAAVQDIIHACDLPVTFVLPDCTGRARLDVGLAGRSESLRAWFNIQSSRPEVKACA